MRIAFVTPWEQPCGIANYSRHLVRALQSEVDKSGQPLDVRVVNVEPRFRRGIFNAVRHRSSDLRYYQQIGEQANDADVAHIQFQYPLFGGFAPWKLKFGAMMQRLRIPVVLTMHELDYKALSGKSALSIWERRLYFHNASIVTWPQIGAIIVHTRCFMEPLRDLMVLPERIHVQPMPVPDPPPLPPPDEAKARLNVTGKRVLSILGFVVKRKGYETAIAALENLPDEVILAIVGGPSEFDRSGYCDALKAKIDQYSGGLSSRIIITGYVNEETFHDWLSATDVVLAPFDEMSGSSSLALAIAAEKPIIASDLPGMLEMCGFLTSRYYRDPNVVGPLLPFERGNARALASAVDMLLYFADPENRLLRDVRAYKDAFSVNKIAKETAELYRTVIDWAAASDVS